MKLQHLRCFVAVAEELHFAKAAEKLHIEQSPLSRVIKELESHLGVTLFERAGQGQKTRLTWPGQVFLGEVRQILNALNNAQAAAKSAAAGYRGTLRIALSDGIAQARLTALLARCREEEPDVEIRLFELPFAQQVKGLENDFYDAGFAQCAEVGKGLVAEPVWDDPLMIAVPARHTLLSNKFLSLYDVLDYPLVLCDPQMCQGVCQQIDQVLRSVGKDPIVVEQVGTTDLMATVVAAGYGLGFTTESQVSVCSHPEIVVRPLAGCSPMLTTYFLRPQKEPSEQLSRFFQRIKPHDKASSEEEPPGPFGP